MSSIFSIEEIVLINNLLYFENFGNPRAAFLSAFNEYVNIGEYIKGMSELVTLDDDKQYTTGMLGYEYKEIINAIKQNEHVQRLAIREIHIEGAEAGGGRSVYLFDPVAREAVVAFKGTEGDAEWVDNVSGLYKVPTDFQQNALAWFQSLSFEDCDTITVTGHSVF
ncbi:MAG: hypothetical protein K6C96_05545 [Butyrivibrio sp.]|nr:hypothetical protein [Butyrivibrio sp.]